MGMYHATVDPRQWQAEFGVDIEHVDQFDIVRCAQIVEELKEYCNLMGIEFRVFSRNMLDTNE